MKSKELIRQIQEIDPTGELEVCIDTTTDILSVERMPAYYDGHLEVLQRDENIEGYNIVGAKLITTGLKIRIHPWSIVDSIWENPNLVVDYSDISPEMASYEKEKHDKTRQAVLEFEKRYAQ
jgi:hypothetical protein